MIEVGDTVTNGARFGDQKTLYLYRVLAIDEDFVWVMSLNGTFKGDRLTFKKDALS